MNIQHRFLATLTLFSLMFSIGACASPSQTKQSSSPTSQQSASPSPQPITITAEDLKKLRWIEGSWRGTGDIDKPFYERYKFENDTTLLVEGVADEKFDKVTDVSRFELKDGHFGSSSGESGSVAVALDDNSITFAPLGKMRNSFRFQRESADAWKAILTWKEKDGTPKERVYKMDRMPAIK
ncbi:MAG TPA: hypothetical protein VJM12_04150 [Pyrinomonadaceae bacterium]|nr:hypothetical protein [Pyrinomonadaceae bacterium]